MEITEVRINLNKGGKVKAFAQIVIDGSFLVGDIRVLEGKEGLVYVAMPSRRLRNGSFRDIAHPLNTEIRRRLDEVIIEEYERTVTERGSLADSASSRSQQIASRLLGEKYWTEEESEED
ncbi:MAG TPA: SpoVG family protein [Thermoanaerobaculaceae bacterium]|mgnify:CR=1 FL=1|nr:SpoVG family protein [Thermoanaerobaculaceae bacterium]HPS77314.1 SpoVG family protein [Thermoanaerobaculaceae bacterium]